MRSAALPGRAIIRAVACVERRVAASPSILCGRKRSVDRGTDGGPARQGDDGSGSAGQSAGKKQEGFSQFITRILDQLSISAWLPAGMLVGCTAVLVQLHTHENLDVAQAVRDLRDKPAGVLIILLFSLVLATMVTQAFEFEVIRLLEGYWGSRWPLKAISALRTRRHAATRARLDRRHDRIRQRAFDQARKTILDNSIVPDKKRYILDIIDDEVYDRNGSHHRRRHVREAEDFDWGRHASPELLRRLDAIEAAIAEFPEDHRLMPTRLGNTLRAVEDSLKISSSGDLEGMVLRNWEGMPTALRQEHDQYRTRLDLYCLLVFVFLVLAVLSAVLLNDASHGLLARFGGAAVFLALAIVGYEAAIASARGYGTVLKTIDSRTAAADRAPGGGVRRLRSRLCS